MKFTFLFRMNHTNQFPLYFRLMVLAEIFSLILYLISLAVLHEYFGKLTLTLPSIYFFFNSNKLFHNFQIGNLFGRGISCGKCL